MSREIMRIEPMLSGAFIHRDYVNRKDKLRDLTPPRPSRFACHLTDLIALIAVFLCIFLWVIILAAVI